MDNIENNFSSRLKLLRGDLSQNRFAAKMGVRQNTYNRWESGLKEPTMSNIIQIVTSCGITSDWLLGFSDNPHPATRGGSAVANGNGVAVSGGVNGNGNAVGNGNVVSAAAAPPPAETEIAELKARVAALEDAATFPKADYISFIEHTYNALDVLMKNNDNLYDALRSLSLFNPSQMPADALDDYRKLFPSGRVLSLEDRIAAMTSDQKDEIRSEIANIAFHLMCSGRHDWNYDVRKPTKAKK